MPAGGERRFECSEACSRAAPVLLASMAYAWDPAWLKAMRDRPGTALTLGGKPVMVHVPRTDEAAGGEEALESANGRWL